MDGLFEVISEDEFRKESTQRTAREATTEPRTLTVWLALGTHTHLDYCTVPAHDEVQKMLNPEQQEYRQKYPTRMVYEIRPGVLCCRDCFIAEADKDGST